MFQSTNNGAETITISDAQDFVYGIFVFDYEPISNYPLRSSGATLQYYSISGGAQEFKVPTTEPIDGDVSRYWMVGCLDPRVGFKGINKLVAGAPSDNDLANFCFQ